MDNFDDKYSRQSVSEGYFLFWNKKKVQWNPKNDEISKIDNRFWSIYKRILFLIKFEIQKRS